MTASNTGGRLPDPVPQRTLMHPGPSIAALAGVTVTASPYIYGFGDAWAIGDGTPQWPGQPWWLLGGCLALVVGGMALNSRRLWDQWIVTAGVAAILAALAPALVTSPALTLAILLLAILLVSSAWRSDLPFPLRSRPGVARRWELLAAAATAAASTAVIAEFTLLLFVEPSGPMIRALGLFLAVLFVLRLAWHDRTRRPRVALTLTFDSAAALALAVTGRPTLGHLVLASSALILIRPGARRRVSGFVSPIAGSPAGQLVTSFAVLCALGALLLRVPAATEIEGGISMVDAVFTAVSAVCVTGLIVLDTPNDFTGLGQGIILLLIQLGALGIMSYSAALMLALGRRLRLREESLLASAFSRGDRTELRQIFVRLLAFTFGCEAIGAALLAGLFYNRGDAPAEALWRGLFTAVSAFCNAGFALQSDSLVAYQGEPMILHVVGALIILGGLSPAAALAVPAWLRRRERRAQIRLVLVTTSILLASGFLSVVAFEWDNTLSDMSLADRLHNAWLQSVTLRTAGFNSVPLDSLRPATLLVMMASMFIGGSPGGTAGGIKTTTAAVMFCSVLAAIRGKSDSVLFGRRISRATIERAGAITTLGVASLFLVVLLLFLTQAMPASLAVFEAVSALATVGLSIGGTSELDSVGKLVIVFAMFAGRVGPLSMFGFLSTRDARHTPQYPIEPIEVG